MVLIKYPKFVQTGTANITAGTSTTVSFSFNFDDIPVVVATPSTLTDVMVNNVSTAGFDVMTAATTTISWLAIYQSI